MSISPVARTERTVTVAALKVDGRAMSMAFFRQLPIIELTDDAMKNHIHGQARWWGYVRREAELWLVVEVLPGRLFRCEMNPPIVTRDVRKKLYDETLKAVLENTEQLFV